MSQLGMLDSLPDSLSPAARDVLKLDVDSAYTQLVVRGGGNVRAKALLVDLSAAELFVPGFGKPVADQEAALAGLWLWHDWLDESHTISQSLPSPTGSFWHAILHRREGDFSNSKYWYARCAAHPALAAMGSQAGGVVNAMPADRLLLKIVVRGFDPNALVDLVEEVHDQPSDPRRRAAVALQQMEWRVLFDHCARR